jgi:hypothetical protein
VSLAVRVPNFETANPPYGTCFAQNSWKMAQVSPILAQEWVKMAEDSPPGREIQV